MQKLIQRAQKLAQQPVKKIILPVKGRVAYVVSHASTYASHGYAVRTHGIAQVLNGHGFDTLCCVRPGRPWELGIEQGSIASEVKLDGVRYIHTCWSPGCAPRDEFQHLERSVERYVEMFQVYRPQVVMAASDYKVGLPAWVAATSLGIPFFYEVRGFWELSRAARDDAYAQAEECKSRAEYDAFVARQAHRVFTLNQAMKDELGKRGVDRDKIDIVPNGVGALPEIKPADADLRRKLGIGEDDKVVGYIGSFSPYEGLDLLLEACTQLVQSGEKLKLLLVGDSQPLIGASAAHIADSGLKETPPWLIQVGRVPHEQVADYYALLDAVVIPRKPLAVCELVPPMKAAEALAYGKRLVVSDVAPLAEYADHFDGVVSFEAGNATSLATALQRSLKLPAPKPSTELLFSAHTEPMVQALKGEGSAAVQKLERETITARKSLIRLAQCLAMGKRSIFTPTAGRVAVVASYPWRANQPGYTKRVQRMVKRFQASGWEALCMVGPFGAGNEEQVGKPEAVEDGVRYLHGQWPLQAVPTSAESGFTTSVEIFSEWFKAHRPQVVVAAGDFTSALPAIVAAQQLSIPIIKEQLHYADSFQERQVHRLFERLDFAQKFAAEQACLELADASYYLYPDDEASWDTLQQVIDQVCREMPVDKPLATLKPKTRYTVRQPVEGAGLYFLELGAEDAASGNPKGIVASFRFLGSNGKPLPQKLSGFSSSKDFPHYQYVDTSAANGRHRALVFQLPTGVSQVEVDVVAFVTQDKLTLHHARVGKVSLVEVARWLSLKVPGVHWIKAVGAFVHKEGAASLRLALFDYNHRLTKHPNDQKQLNGAIQEMVELDRAWLPELAHSSKTLPIKATNGRLTVAHLHKTAYPYENTGGAIRCLNTALSQQRMGIDPYIVTPIGYPRSAGVEGAKNHEVIEGIEHFRIGANTDGLRGISLADRTRYSTFHIAKLLKQRGASVIHAASGVRGYELALQALALKRLTGLPLLYEVRSFHEHTWTPVRNDVMDLERTQLRVIKENFCMAEADFVTTISYSMKKILIERGVAAEKIEVIPNAIDESKYLGKTFSPMPIPGLEGAEMVVGYISNMSRREGHQYLIRAIHQLRQRTGRDIRGLLVGNGPERESLEQLAVDLGMKEVIAFPGEVDHSQINAYYKAIDLFVIPRIPDYAADWVTPLKPYEAMALERPIIVSDLPALKEIVGDNEERGLVAKPADVESLVTQLQRYIEDSAMRERKVNTAREWVFAERTWSANAQRYDAIYRRLMANHATSEKEALHA
jgi:glycosyltransferase involved in cell wall biosynthesis